ncbi:MAG: gliding motility-associated C-terminal domain-containing protein [Flavobacteriaceae bacterium]|nr:gliding motility-associated C-terminal domain-containing protein [Flavobacteriaceae bacterium]
MLFSFDPVVWVPNAFSPNEDRLNDLFQLKGGSLKHFEIHIYNRWGEKMFASTSLDNSWNGYFHDHPCQQDVYVYYIKYWGFDNVLKTKTGNITLLK